jgi:hypothetical protein
VGKYPELKWETWRDLISQRQEARIDIYMGRQVRDVIVERSRHLGISMTEYVRACVLHFVRQHPSDADPRR